MADIPEDVESKAGHPAAMKVGGMRIPNRTRKNSEEASVKEPVAEEEEEEVVSKSPKTPSLVMWGQVRDPQKDYPSQAVQHMQNKPTPTHEPSNKPASAKPNVIQQPRK
ncbi:DAP1/DAPL1 [Trinorchestia longiramus]|nr:DAP1/DAPL1 [Trinorchestia longiramus]